MSKLIRLLISKLIRLLIIYSVIKKYSYIAKIYDFLKRSALRYLVNQLRKELAVKSIYLRRSAAFGDDIYDISDLDIGVVINCDKKDMLTAKHAVYAKYINIIRRFPKGYFDTNLAIYTDEEINDLLFNIDVRGLVNLHHCYRLLEGINSWQLLYGEKVLPANMPEYDMLLKRLIAYTELCSAINAINNVCQPYTDCLYPVSKDKIANMKLIHTIYKHTADALKFFVLFRNPDSEWFFNRKSAIDLGILHLNDMLSEEDTRFLLRIKFAYNHLFCVQDDIDNLFLEYRRFGLRFHHLIQTNLTTATYPEYEKIHLSAETVSAIVKDWYPEFSKANACIRDEAITKAPIEKVTAKKVYDWFSQTIDVDADIPVVANQQHSFSVFLAVKADISLREVRSIMETVRLFNEFAYRSYSNNILLYVNLYSRGIFSQELNKTDMVNAFFKAKPPVCFKSLYPTLLVVEKDTLAFLYEKFWQLIFSYSKYCFFSAGVVSVELFGMDNAAAEHIMRILKRCDLPEELLGKIENIYNRYKNFLEDEMCNQPTYTDMMSCCLEFEDYILENIIKK